MKPTGSGSWSEKKKKKSSQLRYSSCRMQGILMGFLQVALCSIRVPLWECLLPAAEPGCANSGDIQVSGPGFCQALRWEGQYGNYSKMNFSKKKNKKCLYNPRGYVLGAGCNCFPHFLRLAKLIHCQQQAVMPWACQWACFLWAFWIFLPCNSKQKSY